jgi:Rha family phage regulatory protein
MTNVPALCIELKVHINGDGAPVVNSRDVAVVFEKRHDNVLRDIEEAREKIASDLRTSWFRPETVLDAYGREQPSFKLTRQGFTLLVMGWSGERAMQFKVRYIQAFDAMEEILRASTPATHADLIQSIREIVAPLAVRFDSQDVAIERVEARVDAIAEDVGSIKIRLLNARKRISPTVKAEHADATRLLGGRCQCCGTAQVILADGQASKFAEYDHFYQNSKADAEHTWLICKPCHSDLSTGRTPRDQREAAFRAYQDKRRRLPGRQQKLF